jgi:hypothetical protein
LNWIGVAVAGLVAAAGVAQAQIKNADVGINPIFEQIDATTILSEGGFFSARAFVTSSGDYTGGTLSYGGPGSPATLVYNSGDVAWEFGAGSGSFPFLQTQYPTGNYTFGLTGGTDGPTTFTIDFVGNTYAANPPQLTAASYTALQGMNAAAPLTVDFNSFVTTGNPNASDIVFTISNSSTQVFDSGFLSSGATSVTIPSGTLMAGQSYQFDLLFSEQVFGENDSPAFGTTHFYDTLTAGVFFTEAGVGAVPEPSTGRCCSSAFADLAS